MRHKVAGRRLGRPSAARRALLRNLTTFLLQYERIKTTTARAKEVRRPVEKMITLAKRGDSHAKGQALAWVQTKEAADKLFETLGPRYAERPGGYTRIVHAGRRKGDAAPMSFIELVDNALPPLPTPRLKKKLSEKEIEALWDDASKPE
eukprot:m.45209 g.45209  ORF g.45209 m.45209 type:complete len:149 (-) comp11763_c2_seq2:485-931(-)